MSLSVQLTAPTACETIYIEGAPSKVAEKLRHLLEINQFWDGYLVESILTKDLEYNQFRLLFNDNREFTLVVNRTNIPTPTGRTVLALNRKNRTIGARIVSPRGFYSISLTLKHIKGPLEKIPALVAIYNSETIQSLLRVNAKTYRACHFAVENVS